MLSFMFERVQHRFHKYVFRLVMVQHRLNGSVFGGPTQISHIIVSGLASV